MRKWIKKSYIAILIAIFLTVIAAVLLIGKENMGPDGETESESIPAYEVETRIEAPYEHWLAAAVVTGISTEYPDFQLGDILAEGEKKLSEYKESTGIYVMFTAEGEEKCIYSVPLEAERTETGTKDVMSTVIGYATFDLVPIEEQELSELNKVEIEDLNTLIEQSEIITVYSR